MLYSKGVSIRCLFLRISLIHSTFYIIDTNMLKQMVLHNNNRYCEIMHIYSISFTLLDRIPIYIKLRFLSSPLSLPEHVFPSVSRSWPLVEVKLEAIQKRYGINIEE